ncbi:hypothetical protein CASFOL_008646 [Castilleja foliolosa]|uniref:Glutaredoxin domain-containing protein n=1 Tax=Castilleja foliolosa TaxID=1961234 RepID=A0ABD3DZK3_9LAMI
MAAAPRSTIRSFDLISAFPRSFFLRTQVQSFSCLANQSSTCYTKFKAARCSITRRNVGLFSICSMGFGSTGSQLEDSVKKAIGENPVVVYSKTWCSYSMEVKNLFKKLGVEPFVVELDQLGPQGSEVQNSLEVLTGQRTVPNVFIGGKHIGGCTDTIKLHQKGELESLLSEAGAKKLES